MTVVVEFVVARPSISILTFGMMMHHREPRCASPALDPEPEGGEARPMGGNSKFLMADATQAWLAQFDAADQPLAVELLRTMKLVSHDQFLNRLSQLILGRLVNGDEPIGVYVARELRKRNGKPHRLFKEVNRKVRRAYGVGPQSVQPDEVLRRGCRQRGLGKTTP
nr:hypothetical protein [Brevundimonas naejangsanensis]